MKIKIKLHKCLVLKVTIVTNLVINIYSIVIKNNTIHETNLLEGNAKTQKKVIYIFINFLLFLK